MKISELNKKIEIEKIINHKKVFFNENYKNNSGYNFQYLNVISRKEYNKIIWKTMPIMIFYTLIPFIFLPLITVVKEQITNEFFSFIIILGYSLLLLGHVLGMMYHFSDILIDKACKKWFNKNKFKMKDVIFYNTIVDNDIMIKIKSLYGKNALSYLFKNYGIKSVTYLNILEFINKPQYYDINLSIDKQIESLIENI